jgi:hypothetical protein
MGYFDVDHVSNSSLGAFKRFLNGEPEFQCKQETLDEGSLMHLAAFEKEKYIIHPNHPHPRIDNMIVELEKNMIYRFMRFHAEAKIEHEYYFRCKFTGAMVKAKVDLRLFNSLADLKGTSCTTQDSFKASVTAYDYNRQAALYMDGTGCKTFTFFGLSKKHPHKTFTRSFNSTDKEIQAGREEYIYLINKGISMGAIQTNKQRI